MRSLGLSMVTVVCGGTEVVSHTLEPITESWPIDRVAAEDRGVGVDHHAVFDRRMAFRAADEVAFGVGGEAQRAERHALVELHPLADLASSRRSPRPCRGR